MALLFTVLNEEVPPKDVISAIKNKQGVVINYSDAENSAPGARYIEPYVYGLTRAGNDALRAYQYHGATKRGVPKWKLFRLDRITSWQPTQQHFNVEPREHGWSAEPYNYNGDKSMSRVLTQVQLEPVPTDTLGRLRMQTANMKNSTPLNIKQMQQNPSGPVGGNKMPQSSTQAQRTTASSNQENPYSTKEFQDMLARNLAITKQEKAKMGVNMMGDKIEPQLNTDIEKPEPKEASKNGPIIDNDTTNALNKDNSSQENNPYNTKEFQDMLARNLAITDKEKAKRGFSLSKR
jgi:hypothetical protein